MNEKELVASKDVLSELAYAEHCSSHWAPLFRRAHDEIKRFRSALEWIAGTHGREAACPRGVAAAVLDMQQVETTAPLTGGKPLREITADIVRDATRYRWLRDALDNEEVTAGLHEAFQQGSAAVDAAIDRRRAVETRASDEDQRGKAIDPPPVRSWDPDVI